jgi:uncharacterized protein YecA (UPF0149 family)
MFRFPFIKTDYSRALDKAREEGKQQATEKWQEKLNKLVELKDKAHALEIAEKDSVIRDLRKNLDELQEVVREASEVSIKAVHFVNMVKNFTQDNIFQSSRMVDAVMKAHQVQLSIAGNAERIAIEASKQLEDDRKKLERGL